MQYIYTYIHTYVHIYIYIYICIHTYYHVPRAARRAAVCRAPENSGAVYYITVCLIIYQILLTHIELYYSRLIYLW